MKSGSKNTIVNINDRKFLDCSNKVLSTAVNRPTVVTGTLNDGVGNNGLSYGADTTFHRTYF